VMPYGFAGLLQKISYRWRARQAGR
jgi:hypothetical protein